MDDGVPPSRHQGVLIDELHSEYAVGVSLGVPLGGRQGHLDALGAFVVDSNVEVFSRGGELCSIGAEIQAQNRVVLLPEGKQLLPGGGMPEGHLRLPTS